MADRWEELEKRCQNCRECSLCETRTNVVFGDGSRTAEIMFVGEGPGAHEDEQGVPFVGKAGQLLDDMLAIIGLDRTMVYIANIVKCRPPQNRDPLGVEQDACIGYLREQVTLLRPKLIVCLGRIAAMRLIREDFKITREHGQWVKKGGFELMAMYHPAALLRDPARRPDAFEDLMSLREKARAAFDIHDRVNYSVKKHEVTLTEKEICLTLAIDTEVCAVIEYFEIFMDRMLLCRRAAEKLGLHFALVINGQRMA